MKVNQYHRGLPQFTGAQSAMLLFGVLLYGVLFALRYDIQPTWLRMVISGCAGAVMGTFHLRIREFAFKAMGRDRANVKSWTTSRIVGPIVGTLVFGVLMGLGKEELPTVWLRALVAGIAACILVLAYLWGYK